MKMKKVIITIFLCHVFAIFNNIYGQSFDGYIDNKYPIWIEITQNNTLINGNYFYKKNGGNIPLTGSVTNNIYVLNEKDTKGLITGVFNFKMMGDSMLGSWTNTKSKKILNFKAKVTDEKYKQMSKIPVANILILTTGKSLSDELNEFKNEKGKLPTLEYITSEKGIISIQYNWETMGAYSSAGTAYHVFNILSSKEIVVEKEISPEKLESFKTILAKELQVKLNAHKKEYNESEWLEVFGEKEVYEKSFQVTNVSVNTKLFYIKNGKYNFVIDHYFDFPHVSQAMDMYTTIEMTIAELSVYLNENSILNNLK